MLNILSHLTHKWSNIFGYGQSFFNFPDPPPPPSPEPFVKLNSFELKRI